MAASELQPLERLIDKLFSDNQDCLQRMDAGELRVAARRIGGTGEGASVISARRLCVWAGRLALCALAAAVLVAILANELEIGGYATQSTEWLAAYDLAAQRIFRRVSHALGLYDTELLRGLGRCVLVNPFHSEPPPLCCGCRPPDRLVRLSAANLTATAAVIDSLYSRSVSPFLLTGAGPPVEAEALDYPRLARFVADHRVDFERGANIIETLAASSATPAVRRLGDLFFQAGPPSAEPPPGRLLLWSFSHLAAARALRRLVPRPAYFGLRTERLLPASMLVAGRRLPPGEHAVGDFPRLLALAYATPLRGRLTARLSAKPACCGPDSARGEAVTLEPGSVLFFPTDCYELRVSQAESDSYAMVHFGFVYNGAHQARRKTTP